MAQKRVYLAVLSLGSDGAVDECCSDIVSMYHIISDQIFTFGNMVKKHFSPPNYLIDTRIITIAGDPLLIVDAWEGRSRP